MTHPVTSARKRIHNLQLERTNWIKLWGELSDNHLSHRGRFLVTDVNKGVRKNTKQLNNVSRRASRTLAAGMMAGITSPARPWFRLALADRKLMEYGPVKTWLMKVEGLMREVFNKSNLYNTLHQTYLELGVFGTASLGIFQDFDTVIRCKNYTIGSYYLGVDNHDKVTTFAREFQWTVAQVVKEFGIENVSNDVKSRWESGDTEGRVTISWLVEPNDNRDSQNPLAKHKKFRSLYWEGGSSNTAKSQGSSDDKFLRESGFDTFPVLSPRWDIVGEDSYALSCPGIDCVGVTKGLQVSERKKYMAIDRMVDPALVAPASLKNKIHRLKPGEIIFDDANGKDGIRSVYNMNIPVQYLLEDIRNIEQTINETFYVDLFLMLANDNRSNITAREVQERHEEKLLMLGPVLERLHNELLDPLIDRTFNIMQEVGMLPPPPRELQEKELRVEYISVLAQAQRLVAVGGIEQLAGFVGNLAQIWPEVRHKFDPAQAVDDMSAALGVAPDIIRSDEEYEEIATQEATQAQQQQQMENAQSAAASAANLAKAPADPNSVLGQVVDLEGGGNV